MRLLKVEMEAAQVFLAEQFSSPRLDSVSASSAKKQYDSSTSNSTCFSYIFLNLFYTDECFLAFSDVSFLCYITRIQVFTKKHKCRNQEKNSGYNYLPLGQNIMSHSLALQVKVLVTSLNA